MKKLEMGKTMSLGISNQTEKDRQLYELAKQYHNKVLEYYQKICRLRAVAMPIDAYEHNLINLNALTVRKRLLDENPDIEQSELLKAISMYVD